MFPNRNRGMASKSPGRFFKPAGLLLVSLFALGLVAGACSQSETPDSDAGKNKTTAAASGRLYEAGKVNCSGFTVGDAAVILGIPATGIKVDAQALSPGNWQCLYRGESFEKTLSFNISLSESVREAVTDMDQYRSHLETARGIEPFKEDLAREAYTEISGLGDDALWTAVNGTLTVRQGNVSIQVQLPKDRDIQVKAAERFLERL